MKCAVCGKEIERTILNKIKGTYIKINSKKKIVICSKCQSILFRKFKNKYEILKNIILKDEEAKRL